MTYQNSIELNHNHEEIQLGTCFCGSSGPHPLLRLEAVPALKLDQTSKLDQVAQDLSK